MPGLIPIVYSSLIILKTSQQGFPGGSVVKNPPVNAGYTGSIPNPGEIDIFLELSCFFDDPVDVGNLISGSSAFSKTSLNIWKFTVHILLKPGLENLLACEMSAIVW